MRVDVYFGAAGIAPADVHGREVAVVDVLRASTTIAVALSNGARNVIPFDSADEVITRAKSFERGEILLAGERKMVAVPGFDLGNSPREFTRDVVEGKSILFTTTNGTAALIAAQGAREALVASYVNFSPVLATLRAALRTGTDVAIICAGRDRQFSLEDAACAGRYVKALTARSADVALNDAAQATLLVEKRYANAFPRLFREAEHARAMADAGFADDLAICADVDAYPIIPVYSERQITRLGPERER